VASHEPDGFFEEYERVFRKLGVKHIAELDIQSRDEAFDEKTVRALVAAG